MNKYDRNKLLKAGFTVLRDHTMPFFHITKTNEKGNWVFHCKYESMAAMQREISRINETEPKMIFE
jgi:hypothetical protein